MTKVRTKGSRVDPNSDVLFQLKKLQEEALGQYCKLIQAGKSNEMATKALYRTISDRRNEINRLTEVRKRNERIDFERIAKNAEKS